MNADEEGEYTFNSVVTPRNRNDDFLSGTFVLFNFFEGHEYFL